MNETPIYQLGYFIPNLLIGNNIDLDKNRFITIENQLYNVYNIFGNGVLAQYDSNGAKISSWNISSIPGQQAVQVSSGKGHINYTYAESDSSVEITLNLPVNASSGSFVYYFYAVETSTTPIDKSVNFIASFNQISDQINYIGLGAALLVVNADNTYSITTYNDAEHGRQEISLQGSLSSLVKNHLHIGGENNPSPIDLSSNVTGFLSSDHIEEIDANKISKGTLDPNRLPLIDHNSLLNIGTLTHEQIDSLLASISYPGNNYSLSDYGIINRLQIILALKKQNGFFNIDGEQINSIFYLPYTQLAGFVDNTNTSAIVNTDVHRVYGLTGVARQSNVIKINTTQDFKTALFTSEDGIPYPSVSNIVVSGVTTSSLAGTVNNPYGITGSATTVYLSSFQDSFISSFSTSGIFINRRINFDPNLNLNTPLGLCYDSTTDYLYIADTMNHRIVVTDGGLNNVYALLGNNNGGGVPGNSGSGFNFPKGVYGLGNTFYVSDSGNNQIQKYVWKNGNPIYQTTYQYSDNSIKNVYQPLNDPRGVFATNIGANNFLFVADYGNHRVLCGLETSGGYSVYQILGGNSIGFGIFNTSLITYTPSSSVIGVGASFLFASTLNGTISSIGVANSGEGYTNSDLFILNYNGSPNGLFYVTTDGAGHINAAYPSYGFSSNNNYGFSHPQGLAVSSLGTGIDLLISDTDNNRLVNYLAKTGVGFGTTNNQFIYAYNIGTSGIFSDTSSSIYFERPAGIFAQQGFSTVFVADSLNNKIHRLSAPFFANSVAGISTYSFGAGDTALTSGGITLDKPTAYLEIAKSWGVNNRPSNWFAADYIVFETTYEGQDIDRYNFVIFSDGPKTFSYQDTIGISFASINESFGSGCDKTLGKIDCYLIFRDDFGSGTKINFTIGDYTQPSILISNLVELRSITSTETLLFKFKNLSSFTTQPNVEIIGFGFKWSSTDAYGWKNLDIYNLKWYLPTFDSSILSQSYPNILTYQKTNSLSDGIFTFNVSQYYDSGYFVFRYDSGVGVGATFDYAIFEFSDPTSIKGASSIDFSYRVDNALSQLNSDKNFLSYSPSPSLSGQAVQIGASGRYIDLIFDLHSSTDRLSKPTISSISLYFSVFGVNAGVIYDTNVSNAPNGQYTRLKWSQGKSSNILISPVSSDNTQAYQISIDDTSNIGKYFYLTTNNLNVSDSNLNESSLIDVNNGLYLSPYQNFISGGAGLLNPQHYISNNENGFFIADTDNDRVIEIDGSGQLLAAIQGNIKLSRSNRDFVILGVYYNTNTKQLYAAFSQYLLIPTGYTLQLSVYVNGSTYQLSDATYFDQINVGLFKINSNSASATFYVNTTSTMDAIFNEYPNSCKFQIQNPAANPPFQPSANRSDGFDLENEAITYSTAGFNEFVYNPVLGFGTILSLQNNVVISLDDPIVFDGNTTNPSAVLWSYYPQPNYSYFYSIPVQVAPIYFDNIFKPIHLDYTSNGTLVVSTVGNNSIRAYDSNFNSLYTIGQNNFIFNEKLGGSAVVIDRTSTDLGNNLLIAQPSIDYSTSNPTIGFSSSPGYLYIYNRNNGTFINEYKFNFDVVKAIVEDNDYLVLLYDWQANGLRSKLLKMQQDGTVSYSLNNVFTKPVSLNIQENGYYYVTDTTGQIGTIFFREFVSDGTGNTVGSGTTGATSTSTATSSGSGNRGNGGASSSGG